MLIKMKPGTFLLLISCVLLWWLPLHSLLAQEQGALRTIVIDPGHGGHDPGALGKNAREKSINLAVALKLGNLIRKEMPGVKVIFTRDRDQFIELHRRAAIANKNKADLFISIHCNANDNRQLRGAETYVMGLHRTNANLNIAKLENAAILLESDYRESYEGFDPNSDESYILFNLYQSANLERSTQLAASIQEELTGRTGLKDRGVRQAGFLVLYKTTMPGVLVEIGYISNAEDERFLASSKGQDHVASAILRAVQGYATQAGGTVEAVPEKNTGNQNYVQDKKDGYEFRIQVASSGKKLPADAAVFRHFKNVGLYRHGGMYKYTVGSYQELNRAKEMLAGVKKRGYADAFLVVFRNNERVPQEEADRLLR